MRFLADENCDFDVVLALRKAGHDVVAIVELSPRADDETVLGIAGREGRILLTEDKDFGQMAHAVQTASGGVILLRFPAGVRRALPKAVVEAVEMHREELSRAFIVIQPGRIRIRQKR